MLTDSNVIGTRSEVGGGCESLDTFGRFPDVFSCGREYRLKFKH